MPIKTGNADLDERLSAELSLIADRRPTTGALTNDVVRIREAIFHDFSGYRFVLPPAFVNGGGRSGVPGRPSAPDAGDVAYGTWLAFERFVAQFQTDFLAVFSEWIQFEVETDVMRESADYVGMIEWWRTDVELHERTEEILLGGQEGFRLGLAADIFEIYVATDRPEACLMAAQEAVAVWLVQACRSLARADGSYAYADILHTQTPAFWQDGRTPVLGALAEFLTAGDDPHDERPEFGDDLPDQYSFAPFAPGTVNFGLQVIYRQGWIPLGTQPGEIVRTLPLAPGQTEKITMKAMRRTQSTRQAEIVTSIETATESSAATKDSSEVFAEAAESLNWKAEGTASASYGFGEASITASAGGENSSTSKDTKSLLNDTMEKTASKIRKDTKIVVTTVAEETSEYTQVSEISNLNDSSAVTNIYSRLQRQYELRTYLSEVNQVIFVAEEVPEPGEIDGPWIRRYDWIIGHALLDDTFRADLETVRSHEADEPPESEDPLIRDLMQTISGDGSGGGDGVPNYDALMGQIPDLYGQQQAAWEREVERRRARDADRAQYRRSVRRLRAHIYDNVLHYCRAIWAAEDPDARMMRYRGIRVPTNWQFVLTSPQGGSSDGYFAPSVTNSANDTTALSDLVHPVGPIGYAGNYMVFYLRESARWERLTDMVRMVQAPYMRFDVAIERAGIDPVVQFRVAVSDDITGPDSYRLSFQMADGAQQVHVEVLRDDSTWASRGVFAAREGQPIWFDSVRVWIDGVSDLVDGTSIEVALSAQPALEDPELKALRWTGAAIDVAKAPQIFTAAVVAAMREYFADVYVAYAGENANTGWDGSTAAQRTLLISRYEEYLLRVRHTTRIVVDTNNLMLTREVDDTSTLEPYKKIHRALDVLKANAELNLESVEVARRQARLDEGERGDPDVDKLTVVAGVGEFRDLAALDGIGEDPSPVDPEDDE